MFTRVCNAGHGATLQHYLPGRFTSNDIGNDDINELEAGIMRDIGVVIEAGAPYAAHSLLPMIAVGIQLWGGKMGAQAFERNGGFAVNCPMESYGYLVDLIVNQPEGGVEPDVDWEAVKRAEAGFDHIKISFLSKHISFWSRGPGVPFSLPILDSIVMEKFIDPNKAPSWEVYGDIYVPQLYADRNELAATPALAGITVAAMERRLFNWLNTSAVDTWHR
jgi:hypothetical protein